MRYGFVLPGGTASEELEQAVIADEAGWDGVFVWEAAYGVDAWTLLASMAQRTQHVRLGTMLTPLPWRRPWKVASQLVTLDQLSGGRAILTVGLGAVDPALGTTGDEEDLRTRADMLDEGIEVIRRLTRGERRFAGKHYTIDLEARTDLSEVGKPVQARVPIWVVGAWPRVKSLRRVLQCTGILPTVVETTGPRDLTPEDVTAVAAWLKAHGAPEDTEIVVEGETPADDREAAAAIVAEWAEAGATWWIETRWGAMHEAGAEIIEVRERLLAGPPRLADANTRPGRPNRS